MYSEPMCVHGGPNETTSGIACMDCGWWRLNQPDDDGDTERCTSGVSFEKRVSDKNDRSKRHNGILMNGHELATLQENSGLSIRWDIRTL